MLLWAANRKSAISAACGSPASTRPAAPEGVNYSTFMNGLKKSGIELNRKMLSEMAIHDPKSFSALVETAKNAAK